MITELGMNEVINGQTKPDDVLRIVMFFGATCGPCKATMPNYELAANYYVGLNANINFYKMNAWEPQEQADFCKNSFKIEGVPHFKAFCRGQLIMEKVGGGDEATMKEFIQSCIDQTFKQFGVRI